MAQPRADAPLANAEERPRGCRLWCGALLCCRWNCACRALVAMSVGPCCIADNTMHAVLTMPQSSSEPSARAEGLFRDDGILLSNSLPPPTAHGLRFCRVS